MLKNSPPDGFVFIVFIVFLLGGETLIVLPGANSVFHGFTGRFTGCDFVIRHFF